MRILFSTCLFGLLLFAQIVSAQEYSIKVRQGIIGSAMSDNDFSLANQLKPGYLAGLSFEYHYSKHFYVGMEMNYEDRGYLNYHVVYYYGQPSHDGDPTVYDLRYVSLPIKVMAITGASPRRFFGYASLGLLPAFLAIATARPPGNVLVTDLTLQARRYDLGVFGEIGVGRKFTDRFFANFGFRLQQSFIPMHSANTYFPPATSFNAGFMYLLELGWNLKFVK